jgi:hypothetical protein
MSDSILTALGKTIVTELNGYSWTTSIWHKPSTPGGSGSFSAASFTAERIYNTERQLEDTETLRVDVVLGDIDQSASSRNTQQGDYRIDIAFRQVIDTSVVAAIDALGALVEEVGDYFFHTGRHLALSVNGGTVGVGWIKSQVIYPYLPTQLRESSQFVSLLRLTYRAIA